MAESEIQAALQEELANVAVVATVFCRSRIGMDLAIEERVSWFLIQEGRVVSYDAHPFESQDCTAREEFVPGDRSVADLEREVMEYRDAHFPEAGFETGDFYRRGLAYLARGRVKDARRMLEAGDEHRQSLASIDQEAEAGGVRSQLMLALDGLASVDP